MSKVYAKLKDLLNNVSDPHLHATYQTSVMHVLVATPETYGDLLELLADRGRTVELRSHVCRVLRLWGNKQASSNLLTVFTNENEASALRLEAGWGLAEVGSQTIGRPIIRVMVSDPDIEVRKCAAFVLGCTGNMQAVPHLVRILTNPFKRNDIRTQAALALGDIRDKRTVESLIETLNTPSLMLRQSVIYALGRIGDVTAIPALQAVNDPALLDAAENAIGIIRAGRT